MSLNNLSKQIFNANVEKGFYEDYNDIKAVLSGVNSNLIPVFERFVTAQRLALITSEVSEALEANRKDNTFKMVPHDFKENLINSEDVQFKEDFIFHVKDTQED